jgi:mRNA interferase RelE/StbE
LKTAFRDSFARDLKAVQDKKLLQRVQAAIESVEKADSLTDLPNLKKLKGAKNYFRLRLGDHRLGIALLNDTIVFVRLLDRKDIYKYFP